MNDIVAALADQHAELDRLLAGLTEADWSRPSRCEGWSIADVVLHLAQTDVMALASLDGTFAEFLAQAGRALPATASVDDGADAMVAHEQGAPVAELWGRWQTTAATLVMRLRESDPHRRVTWVAGELAVQTLATTRLAEAWIHTGDVAYGLGAAPAATDGLRFIARLAWRTLPYAFAQSGRELAGPVAVHLTGPAGEAWDFDPDGEEPVTTITGPALDFCLVAGRRANAADTALQGTGPDAAVVLELVRTYA